MNYLDPAKSALVVIGAIVAALSIYHNSLVHDLQEISNQIQDDRQQLSVQINRLNEALTHTENQAKSENIATINAAASEFAKMPLTTDERATVSAIVNAARSAAEKLDIREASRIKVKLSQLLAYAKTPVNLEISDSKGSKSGVERSHTESDGKLWYLSSRWYLVVNATDAAGNLVSIPVQDSERGTSTYQSTFGVRVTEDQYKQVEAEKMKDGHINDRAIGFKPEGSLTIKYNQRTSTKPDVITTW